MGRGTRQLYDGVRTGSGGGENLSATLVNGNGFFVELLFNIMKVGKKMLYSLSYSFFFCSNITPEFVVAKKISKHSQNQKL